MPRTPLKDRTLPNYTRGNEIFNMVSHIVGAALGIVALVTCVIMGALRGTVWSVVSGAIFGASMILLYTISSVYHGLKKPMAKKVMQVLDHCTIYLLIAGTYTPVTLVTIRSFDPAMGWVIFGVVWAAAILGSVFTAIDFHKYRVLSYSCYFIMGWSVLVRIVPVMRALGRGGSVLLLSGGLFYMIGAVLYAIGANKKPSVHGIFHIFCLAGSLCHYLMVLFYIMPVT